MSVSAPQADSLAEFARLAAEFCDLVERRDHLGRDAFLAAVHTLLAPLYAAALALPPVEVFDDATEENTEDGEGEEVDVPAILAEGRRDRMGADGRMALYRALGAFIGEYSLYAEVFDPYARPPEEPVTGSLADDVADIYQDLAGGLAKWRRSEVEAALWEWRFRFTIHWGEHVASALRALHALAADRGLGFPHSRTDA